jgi:hypothetical protein
MKKILLMTVAALTMAASTSQAGIKIVLKPRHPGPVVVVRPGRPVRPVHPIRPPVGQTVLLGETRLSVFTDSDQIEVRSCGGIGDLRIKAMSVQVLDQDADVDSVVVTFGDGQRQELAIRQRFAQGTSSRWVDLAGGGRCIKSIKVVGDSHTLFGRHALVRVYGLTGR